MRSIYDLDRKYLLEESTLQGGGYINRDMVDQEKSYYISSKSNVYGSRWLFQYVTFKDGNAITLASQSASTRGEVARKELVSNVGIREVKKNFTEETYAY